MKLESIRQTNNWREKKEMEKKREENIAAEIGC